VTSQARISANQANAKKSTGPTSVEGKNISRRNSLKHGMAGAGVVLPEEVAVEVERVDEELQAELNPRSGLGKILVRQLASTSVRMERGSMQESAALAVRVRHASEDFDEERIDRADRLFDALGDNPRGQLRRLRKSPEGVDRLVREWEELRADLTRDPKPYWVASHLERAAHLIGLRSEAARGSRFGALSRGFWGDFEAMGHQEGGGLAEDDRKEWARARLVERIDAEIAALEAHFETIDFEPIALDRAEAPARALFDPSREATLARRYEAEAQRNFFKALKELRRVEAEAAARPKPAPVPAPAPPEVELGSFRGEDSPTLGDLLSYDHRPASTSIRASRVGQAGTFGPLIGRDGQPLAIGGGPSGPG
jgi:hypothetical protein